MIAAPAAVMHGVHDATVGVVHALVTARAVGAALDVTLGAPERVARA